MAEQIMTVLGPIEPEALGVTLAHEHLLFDLRCLWEEPPPERAHLADAEPTLENRGELTRDPYHSKVNLHVDDPALVQDDVRRYRAVGGTALVDLTTKGLAPNPEAAAALSSATGLHIVQGAGYYRRRCLPDEVDELSEEALADELEGAVREGLLGTSVRAGILGELGTASPIRPFEERQLRAAARVQRSTGVGINVHPQIWAHEHLRIIEILEAAGADLSRVAISHCDQLVEPEWHARIAERGVLMCFDTFGSEGVSDTDFSREPHDTERLDCLLRLLEAGRADQLLLSHDVCTRLQLHRYGGWGYDHILVSIVPRLRRAGVSQADIDQMLIDNPRRLLAMPAR
jgi:phosphotriesterase-related protein